MIPIDTIVSIKSGDEYGGKYTGKLGVIKKFTDDRVGVEFAGLKNHASKYGLFWFKKENVTPSLFDAPKRFDAIIPAARYRSVSIYISPDGGVSVSVFPWPDEETLRNMRASGLISHNDYRTRLGLSPMKD